MSAGANEGSGCSSMPKTTKYSIPLFFVCVKTNISYSVVAEFVTQSENYR